MNRSELAMRQARQIGRVVFAGRWNRAELLDDCESTAWELERAAPSHVGPGPIACLACKRVKISRQFPKRTARSVWDDWQDRRSKRPRFTRTDLQLEEELAAPNVDPAELACFILDYKAWLARLDKRTRKLAKLLASGESTRSASKQFDVSDGRISQIRRELETDWKKFQGEN